METILLWIFSIVEKKTSHSQVERGRHIKTVDMHCCKILLPISVAEHTESIVADGFKRGFVIVMVAEKRQLKRAERFSRPSEKVERKTLPIIPTMVIRVKNFTISIVGVNIWTKLPHQYNDQLM